MRLIARALCLLLAAASAALHAADADTPHAAAASSRPPTVLVVRIVGGIGPATADHVQRGLERAQKQGAQLVVLQLDTPGGLDGAMRAIIQSILASPIPVAGFVGPQGARAASAGTYILYATHIAAMAPATTLGAATPVAIGMPGSTSPPPRAPLEGASAPNPGSDSEDAMAAKRISDAVAYLRGLALLRGRNAEWAERAVREAASLPASEALEQRVIDVIAADVPALLRQLDGRKLRVREGAAEVTLATAQAPVTNHEPDWRGRLLAAVADPSVALILMMIGVYGLLFEFMSPGAVAPGVIGGVCLLLGLWGLQMLPVNYAGLALLLLGIGFLVAEAFLPSFGLLGLGGIVAFALGALLLFDTDVPGFGVPIGLIVGLTITSAIALLGIVGMAARARRRPLASGASQLIGMHGVMLETSGGGDNEGWAEVRGERWRVRGSAGLRAGQAVRITRVDGLELEVAAADSLEGNTR